MYSPKYPVDQSIVNIGSNPMKTKRAQSEFQPSNFQNKGNKQRTKNLVELLKEDSNIQYVEYPEELFQVPENSVALVPIQIMRDILKSYQYNNEELQRMGNKIKEYEQKRLLLKFKSGLNYINQ